MAFSLKKWLKQVTSLGLAVDPSRLSKLDAPFEQIRARLEPAGVTYDNLLIGGGAVRDTLMGIEPKDYDFFVSGGPLRKGRKSRLAGETTARFLRKLREQVLSLEGEYFIDMITTTSEVSMPKYYLNKSRYLYANVMGLKYPAQIIVYNYTKTLKEVVDSFDIDICTFGYNPKYGLITTENSPSFLDLKNKMMGAIPVRVNVPALLNVTLTESRLKRFEERYGCDIKPAMKQMANIPKDHTVNLSYPRYGQHIWVEPS